MFGVMITSALYMGVYAAFKARKRRIYAVLAITLFALTLWQITHLLGITRAVPIWIGILTVAGLLNIVIAARLPRYHAASYFMASAAFLAGVVFS